jgi:hypothetical protein
VRGPWGLSRISDRDRPAEGPEKSESPHGDLQEHRQEEGREDELSETTLAQALRRSLARDEKNPARGHEHDRQENERRDRIEMERGREVAMEKRPHRARRAARRTRNVKKLRKRAAESDGQQEEAEQAQSGSRARGPTEKRLGKWLPCGSRLVSI